MAVQTHFFAFAGGALPTGQKGEECRATATFSEPMYHSRLLTQYTVQPAQQAIQSTQPDNIQVRWRTRPCPGSVASFSSPSAAPRVLPARRG